MWKVCQLLKVGRSQISRSRNANTLSSPAQPSSSASFVQEEHAPSQIYKRSSEPPVAFTPSVFRSWEQKRNRKCLHTWTRGRAASSDDDTIVEEQSSYEKEEFGRDSYESHSRPGHDHDGWQCRCRCRFGDWLGYTTMVAATIHLSRITVYLQPSNKDNAELQRQDSTDSSVFTDFKDAVQNGWRRFFIRAAPVLFPDLFKRWYVLPSTRDNRLESSNPQLALEDRSSAQDRIISAARIFDEPSSTSSSASTSSTPATRSRSTSDDCAVQTDSVGVGTPFDDFMIESGRRLAAFTRMTDVGLEHAIGVDLLKRQLYDEAIDYLLGAARSGHAGALYNLGICYSRGYGVRKDMTKAVEMWRSAADQGHGLSKYQMGVCHVRGLGGLSMDHARALRYMEAASSAGVPEAKTFLAAHEYKQGRLEGALDLLRQAVAGGDQKAGDLLRDWPFNANTQRHSNSTDGYVFENLAKIKAATPSQSVTKRIPSTGRRRFWASSSSEKDESVSSSSSSIRPAIENSQSNSSSSVVFADDATSDSGDLKSETKMSTLEISGSHAIETVASLLTLGTLRRSKTAPEISSYDKVEVAIVTTGNIN